MVRVSPLSWAVNQPETPPSSLPHITKVLQRTSQGEWGTLQKSRTEPRPRHPPSGTSKVASQGLRGTSVVLREPAGVLGDTQGAEHRLCTPEPQDLSLEQQCPPALLAVSC